MIFNIFHEYSHFRNGHFQENHENHIQMMNSQKSRNSPIYDFGDFDSKMANIISKQKFGNFPEFSLTMNYLPNKLLF